MADGRKRPSPRRRAAAGLWRGEDGDVLGKGRALSRTTTAPGPLGRHSRAATVTSHRGGRGECSHHTARGDSAVSVSDALANGWGSRSPRIRASGRRGALYTGRLYLLATPQRRAGRPPGRGEALGFPHRDAARVPAVLSPAATARGSSDWRNGCRKGRRWLMTSGARGHQAVTVGTALEPRGAGGRKPVRPPLPGSLPDGLRGGGAPSRHVQREKLRL